MKKRLLIVGLLGSILFSSCVENRKVVMLQKNDLAKKDLPKDSVVRKYAVEKFDYTIQTNDIISVRFQSLTPKEFDFFVQEGQANMNINLAQGSGLLIGELVDENGEIPIPVVGKVKVTGLTIFQAQDKLQQLANQYLESPIVKVRLLNYRITILGEVNREGSIVLTNNRASMLEAIGLAGGLGDLADRRNVKLIRQVGQSVQVEYIDLLSEDFINSPFYYVYQNDVLIVPPLRQRPYRKYFGQNLSLVVASLSLLLLVINYTKK